MSEHEMELPPVDPRTADAAAGGCEESRLLLNRRAFMGVTAGFYTWAFTPRSSRAAGQEERLLIVILRGGMDGLHVVAPIGDANYFSCRKTLALDPAKQLSLDGFFYLNACMPNFYSAYKAGDAAVVNAIAPPLRVRSHFECQFNLESGQDDVLARSTPDGWMNRLLAALPAGNAVKVDGLQVGPPPLILAGNAPVLAWSPAKSGASQTFNSSLQALYDRQDAPLGQMLRLGLETDALASDVLTGNTLQGLDLAFYGAGKLLAASSGPRIAVLSVDGWDTHVNQTATLTTRMTGLDSALANFKKALGPGAWGNTVVACVSEFGRTAWDMGRDGTDHGTGTLALLMGGAVAGGRVITQWPGLAQNQLVDGRDLQATYDTRQLFKGILQDHLGVPSTLLDTKIFPSRLPVSPIPGLIKT